MLADYEAIRTKIKADYPTHKVPIDVPLVVPSVSMSGFGQESLVCSSTDGPGADDVDQ
jgi:hypothetical protein